MATQTKHIDALANLTLAERADLEAGEAIACCLTNSQFDTVWMYCGKVSEVSEDGTLVVFDDEATTAKGTVQTLVKSDWIARWS